VYKVQAWFESKGFITDGQRNALENIRDKIEEYACAMPSPTFGFPPSWHQQLPRKIATGSPEAMPSSARPDAIAAVAKSEYEHQQ
jgi:hypothetical protein